MLWIDPGRICPSLQRASTMTLRLSINKDVDYFESTLHVRLSFVSIFAEFVSVTYLTGILCDVFHHCGVSDDDFDFFFDIPIWLYTIILATYVMEILSIYGQRGAVYR